MEKLADEYRALGPEVVGTDDLEAIFAAMRSDPKLHFETGEQLVDASEVAMERAWQAMPEWFETLPQAPVRRPVDADRCQGVLLPAGQ